MDKLQIAETNSLTPIEIALGIDEEGRTTAKKLYEFLELENKNYSRWCKTNILENEFAEESIDYIPFVINEECGGQASTDYKLSSSFAKKLAIGTHNFKGEAAKNYFIKIEEKLKERAINTSQLSPELQMFNNLFKALAINELEQKKLQESVLETREEVQAIRDVMVITPQEDWREKTNFMVKKICFKVGDYSTPKETIYKSLETRAKCKLSVRLENLTGRALKQGMAKSKANKLNFLDVIADDPKLIEIYTAIVKEMAIKNKVA